MPGYRLTTVTIEIESHTTCRVDEAVIVDEHNPDFEFLSLESPTNCQMLAAVYEAKQNIWLRSQGKRLMVTDVRRIS